MVSVKCITQERMIYSIPANNMYTANYANTCNVCYDLIITAYSQVSYEVRMLTFEWPLNVKNTRDASRVYSTTQQILYRAVHLEKTRGVRGDTILHCGQIKQTVSALTSYHSVSAPVVWTKCQHCNWQSIPPPSWGTSTNIIKNIAHLLAIPSYNNQWHST